MELNYSTTELSATERVLVGLCENINEKPLPKRLQRAFHNSFGRHFIRLISNNLLDVRGLEHVVDLQPDRGVLLCSNHRSFYDMYMVTSVLRNAGLSWFKDVYFPVRSNFFYDQWTGLALNLAISGGAMYPPIFRDRNKSGLNKVAVNRIVNLLERPGAVVGMHPEGTRGKGDDPYTLLPAKPGVGRMALRSKATVLPIWVTGIQNDLGKQVVSKIRSGSKRGQPVRISFRAHVELADQHASREDELSQESAKHIKDAIADQVQAERTRIIYSALC